jgi:hypothetical protein
MLLTSDACPLGMENVPAFMPPEIGNRHSILMDHRAKRQYHDDKSDGIAHVVVSK